MARDLRFDNVPFGRTQFAPTLWTKSVTVGAQSLRPPRAGGLLITLSRARAFENPLPIRDLRFDPVPSGWSDSSTERFSALLNQGMNDNLAPIQKLVWV